MRLTALDLVLLFERSITCPFLESYTLPELSTIRVLGEAEALLLLTDELLLPETALLDEAVALFLPETSALRVPLLDALPETFAMEEVPLLVAALRL